MLHDSAHPDTPAAKTEVLNQLNKGVNRHPVWISYHLIITLHTTKSVLTKQKFLLQTSKEKQGDQKRSLEITT
jgi:hypothetical protein